MKNNKNKQKLFKYAIDKKMFLKNSYFSFDKFPISIFLDILDNLEKYTKNKMCWEDLESTENNYHFIDLETKISNLDKNFYTGQSTQYLVNQIKFKKTKIERIFYYRIHNTCFPIGYDKYHYLYSDDVLNDVKKTKKHIGNRISGLIYYNLIKTFAKSDVIKLIDCLSEQIKHLADDFVKKSKFYLENTFECKFKERFKIIKDKFFENDSFPPYIISILKKELEKIFLRF